MSRTQIKKLNRKKAKRKIQQSTKHSRSRAFYRNRGENACIDIWRKLAQIAEKVERGDPRKDICVRYVQIGKSTLVERALLGIDGYYEVDYSEVRPSNAQLSS